jgi:hypothetical protein
MHFTSVNAHKGGFINYDGMRRVPPRYKDYPISRPNASMENFSMDKILYGVLPLDFSDPLNEDFASFFKHERMTSRGARTDDAEEHVLLSKRKEIVENLKKKEKGYTSFYDLTSTNNPPMTGKEQANAEIKEEGTKSSTAEMTKVHQKLAKLSKRLSQEDKEDDKGEELRARKKYVAFGLSYEQSAPGANKGK